MSVSKNIIAQQIAELNAELQHTADSVNKRISFLQALPEDCQVPQSVRDFGYCSEGTITFQVESSANVQKLLADFPPIPLVMFKGFHLGFKPLECLRAEDGDVSYIELFPVAARRNGRGEEFQWWTMLQGVRVSIEAVPVNKVELDIASIAGQKNLQVHSYIYDTGSIRGFSESPPALELKNFPLDDWLMAWNNAKGIAGFNGTTHPRMVNNLIYWARRLSDEESTNSDALWSRMLGLSGAPVPQGQELADAVAQNWGITAEGFETLQAFIRSQLSLLPSVRVAQGKAFLDIKNAFARILAGRGIASALSTETVQRIDREVQRQTGLKFRMNWLNHSPTSSNIHVRVSCIESQDVFAEFDYPVTGGQIHTQDLNP